MTRTRQMTSWMTLSLALTLILGLHTSALAAAIEGQPAPNFSLPGHDGKTYELADFKGQKVVVYFYPKNDTPGCTKEACSIRDDYGQFEANGIQVFGISYDDIESHQAFAKKYELPFTLLSDADKSVSAAFGAKGLFVPSRKTYLIDEAGVVRKIYEDVDVTSHGGDILAAFKALD